MLLLLSLMVLDNHHRCFHNHVPMNFSVSINRTHDIISVSSCIYNKFFKHVSMYFLQIYVLYQGPPFIQYGLCLSISYSKCWFVSIIHNLTILWNTVFNTNKVNIPCCVVFILFIDIIVCFPQLLHLIGIFSILFWSSCPLLYHQLIWNIDNIFNNDGNSVIVFSILSEVYSMISKKDNRLIPFFILVGQ